MTQIRTTFYIFLLSFLLFGLITPCFSQFNDDFSDGDFTNNPAWVGNTADWTINTGQLQSNSSQTSTNFYLSTASSLATNASWEFWINLKFNPSSANYVDVFLISDNQDLQSNLNGYFVRIGNTADEVSLYRKDGSSSSILIDGLDKTLNKSSNTLKVKVTRDVANLWRLWTDFSGIGNNYTEEGNVTDATYTTSSYFGISIQQSTSSFFQKHFFDDFVVGTIQIDNTPPSIASLSVINNKQLDVYFNEPVELTSAETVANYSIDNGIGNPASATRDLSNFSLVHLNFTTSFQENKNYTLSINGVADLNANSITSPINKTFSYSVSNYRAVVINEIFADPTPTVALPEKEFIELYNTTSSTINLNNWQFVNTTTAKTLPSFSLSPDQFVILCSETDTASFSPYGKVIGIPSWTSLSNSGDSLTLLDNYANVIDIVTYTDSWYKNSSKSSGGWTLELINPNQACSGSDNWRASENALGGTPGIINSVHDTTPDSYKPTINEVSFFNNTSFFIEFSEKMDTLSIKSGSITVDNGKTVTDITISSNAQQVFITLDSAIDSTSAYTITVSGMADCSGNLMDSYTQKAGIGIAPQPYEIVFTEFFPDPSTESEFVEIYNASNKAINLSGVTISDLSSKATIGNGVIFPDEYIIIASAKDKLDYVYLGKTITVSSLPSLNNSSDKFTLRTASGVELHSVSYSSSWYGDAEKAKGGWTLEMIDPTNPCGESLNWKASNAIKGGTPGAKNSVYGSNPDNFSPQILTATAVDTQKIEVVFNETIDTLAIMLASFSLNNSILIDSLKFTDTKTIVLYLNASLEVKVSYQLTVQNISDCIGNLMASEIIYVSLPEKGVKNDIIINEVLFNPKGDGSDFVELYNNSDKIINLHEWKLANISKDSVANKKSVTAGNYLLEPGKYVAITKDVVTTKLQYSLSNSYETFLQIATLPTYANDKGVVVLLNNANEEMDRFSYTDDMHFELLPDVDGVSLERIDFNKPTIDLDNWHSASHTVGFATPGYENSQHHKFEESDKRFTVSPEMFSPDNDGFEDIVSINYRLNTVGQVASIYIFDAKGVKVKNLISGQLLGNEGTFIWDGITEENEKARIGIYVILIELFDLTGKVEYIKIPCVVAGKI